jgi:GH25 family lysozyme M1 (1,4-beta-N-acetylmuramidase)
MILGVDLASYQGAPDFEALKKANIGFAVTKVTEGTSYVFTGARRNRAEAQRVGMVAGLYHFARGGDPQEEAHKFLDAVGELRAGEFLVLDWEIRHPDLVNWCKRWLDAVYARAGVRALVYLNESSVKANDWGSVAQAGHGLWLAKYDERTDSVQVPHFGRPVMKQYSKKGKLPGIAGNVDLNVFYGSPDDLRFYGAKPATPPAPKIGPDSLPTLTYGDTGPPVKSLQGFLNAEKWRPPLPLLPVTGNYLDKTAAVLKAAQAQMSVRGGDGRNVGPQTKAALWARGWRG